MQFSQRVVDLALAIPPGRVTTYGDLARAAGGGALAARSITSILSKYPNRSAIPWHRIVYASGTAWLPDEQAEKHRRLYKKERIVIDERGRIENFAEIRVAFEELAQLTQ